MTSFEKLYEKAKLSPNNFSFEDLCLLAEKAGFVFARQSGTTHRIYKHAKIKALEGMINLQNVRGKAKPYQVRQVLALIEEYELMP